MMGGGGVDDGASAVTMDGRVGTIGVGTISISGGKVSSSAMSVGSAVSIAGGIGAGAGGSSSPAVMSRTFIYPRFCPDVELLLKAFMMEPSLQLSLYAVALLGGASLPRVSTLSAFIWLREYPVGLPSLGFPVGGQINSR